MSKEAKGSAAGLAVVFCVGWFLFGNQFALVVLGITTVVLLFVIAHTISHDLPREEIEAISGRAGNVESKLDDILEELKLHLPNNLRSKRAGKSRQTTTENNTKEAELFFKINAFCQLAKVDAETLARVDAEGAEPLREAYERRKQNAIALARQIRDPIGRDPALETIIDLCMDAKDESGAKKLFDAIEEDFFAERILSKYPQLGAAF